MRRNYIASVGATLLTVVPHIAQAATTYYVATTGSDSATGAEGAPFATVVKANSVVVAGDTVTIRGGTYKITAGTNSCASQTDTVNAIALAKSGSAGNLIKYWAAPNEVPVFDYTDLMADCRVKGFLVSGSYIHMKGIEVTGVKQRNQSNHESWGVWISGSNNVFELLNIHHIDGTGLFIGKGGGNLVLNSDSHHNFDPLTSNGACESGDGFGAHIPAGGTGNVFRGCRAWFNSDDDFDLINAFESVTIEDCWAWHAGYRYDTGASCGNGNGIKSGGYGTDTATFPANPPVHVIRGNLAVGNKAAGFYANHHPGNITFYNNTGYGNHPNFNMLGMSTSGADITVGTYRNNLAVSGTATSNATSPNDANNSWSLSVTASDADFSTVGETGLDGPRQTDGSLPTITNYHLVAGSDLIDKGVDVGLAFSGTKPDLGCFETGLTTAAGAPNVATGGTSAGGANATGGTPSTGSTASAGRAATTGGNTARGGATLASGGNANGGATTIGLGAASGNPQGGASSSGGGNAATAIAAGGLGGAATASSAVAQGGLQTTFVVASGGATSQTNASSGGAVLVSSAPATGSSGPGNGTTADLNASGDSKSAGCNCHIVARHNAGQPVIACLLLALATLGRRRKFG